jgi:predicted PurR-regulated permease PerM
MKAKWSLSARYFTLGLVIVLLFFIGYEIRELFRPLILAGVISYVFYPLVMLMQRRFRLTRRTASNIVFFVSLALLILLPIILVPILVRQTTEISQDIQQSLSQAEQYFAVPIYVGGIPIDLAGMIAQYKDSLTNPLTSISQNPVSLIRNTSRSTLWLLIVVGAIYFFMTEWEVVREGLIRITPISYRSDVRKLYAQIKQVWMAYLRGQLTLMIIVAVTFIVVWTAIGLPGSLYLGLLAGLFSIVPDLGPIAATIIALAVALLEGSYWLPVNNITFGLIVVGLFIVLINVEHIWLRPYILGRSVQMNETVIFVAIIAAVILSGILAAFIIVPVLASLVVIWNYLHARILGLPPFQDEVPAAPIPDMERSDESKPDSAPPQSSIKKKSSK